MMDFEEYVSANYKRLEGQTRELVEDAFKAGQQSKQAEIEHRTQVSAELAGELIRKRAEIDALQAKIEDITKWAEFHIEDYNLSESDSEHDRGWFNAACQVFKSLKGD